MIAHFLTGKSQLPMNQVKSHTQSPHMAIIGGGQLAKMMALSALPLGIDVSIMGEHPDVPAMRATRKTWVGDWHNMDALLKFAEHADIVTLENEFVNADHLSALEQVGCKLFPYRTQHRASAG